MIQKHNFTDIDLAKMTPAGFAMYASKGMWQMAKHLALLNRKLMDVAAGRIKRLMISCPPRHGKSLMTSTYFPTWFLGTYPDKRIIFATYEARFAEQFGAASRDLMKEFGEQVFGINVNKDAAGFWNIENHLGSMTSVGAGGAITGRGADLLLLDDLIKNNEEADSAVMREKLWAWYGKTALTRLQPGGSIVIIATRWHFDDIMGRLIEAEKTGGDKWEKIVFPAIAEEDEPLPPMGMGRKKGEALWPEMWNIEKINSIKNSGSLTSYGFSALYQQSPVPEGGSLFKEDSFKYFTTQNEYYVLHGNEKRGDNSTQFVQSFNLWKFITVDTADKVKNTSDKTGICIWGVTPNKDLLLLSAFYDRYNYDQIIALLIELNKMWRPEYIGIENKGVAIQLITEVRNRGLAVRALEPEGKGKENRANQPLGAVVRMESGKIYFDKTANYFDELKKQLLFFPKGSADEFVDNLAYAANELTKIDMYSSGDFHPYAIADASPVGIRKAGNTSIASSWGA